MGSGGARVGAGRPRKNQTERWLAGDAGKRGQYGTAPDVPVEPLVVSSELLEPPAALTKPEAAYWALWAPLAAQNGTLVEATRPGLVVLCQIACRCARMWGQIEAEGFTLETVTVDGAGQEHVSRKAHPLLGHYRGLVSRQEQLLARYGLAGSGKMVHPAAKPDAAKVDPFTAHQQRGLRAVK